MVDMELPLLGLAEAMGGGGATMVDLVLVCELAGQYLAPAPLVETIVATRLLASSGEPALLGSGAGGKPVGLALHSPVDGTARAVSGGAVAEAFVVMDPPDLVLVTSEAPGEALSNIAASPLADRSLRDAKRKVIASGPAAEDLWNSALAEWKVLTAAQLVGLSEAALDLAVAYAKARHQFGVPIGSFQALAHRLADAATGADGAKLLTRQAAWVADTVPEETTIRATMAFVWAAETARMVSADCVHIHGGMGFTLECDAQLYFRRASGWPQVWDGVPGEYQRLADALYGQRGAR